MELTAMKMVFSQEFWRMAVFWTLSILYSYSLLLLSHFFPSSRPSPSYPRCRFSPDPDSKIQRPICIVTGATSGLGAATARALAGEGYHVVLVARSPQLLAQTIEEIKRRHKDAYLRAFEVDLSSVHSIVKFESEIKQWLSDSDLHPSLQLLVNNAGILAASCRVTVDGYEQMMETNYISAFVLTNLLLPLLKNSPVPSRVVNVTSFTHRSVSHAEVDRKSVICLSTPGKYSFSHVYAYSKLCLLLFSYELHRQLYAMDSSPNISVKYKPLFCDSAVDPGVVKTNLMRELPQCLSQLAFTVLRFLWILQSPEDAVGSVIDAVLAPHEVSGKYFFGGNGRTVKSSSLSYNTKLAEDLWTTSNMLFRESLSTKA